MTDDDIKKELSRMATGFGMTAKDNHFIMVREYALPECIGCMVRVEYYVGTVVNDLDAKISFQATIYRRLNHDGAGATYEDEHSLIAYEDEIRSLYSTYQSKRGESDYAVRRKAVKKKLDYLIRVTEAKLKNIFGLECLG